MPQNPHPKRNEAAEYAKSNGSQSSKPDWPLPSWLGFVVVGSAVAAAGVLSSSSVTASAPSANAGSANGPLGIAHWQLEECEEMPALEAGEVTVFRGAVLPSDLSLVHSAQAEAQRQPTKMDYERSFGYESAGVKGHSVTFLHTVFLNSALRLAKRLHCLTLEAQRVRDWGLDAEIVVEKLQPRSVELITYDAAMHNSEADSNLGWHSDLGSLLTTALALSEPSDYEGGAFEIRPGGTSDSVVSQVKTNPGDVIVWRGWDPHRVAPVSQGRRQVLVVEWWLGPANSDPKSLRGIKAGAESIAHKARSYELAVEVDPGSPTAQLNLATHFAEEVRDLVAAEQGFRKALELAPSHAIAHLKLGKLLKRKGRAADALQEMRTASELEPASADFALVAAVAAVSQGDPRGLARLEAAAKLAPNQAKTRFTIATALASINRMAEARTELARALAIEPSHIEALALDISLGQLDLIQDRVAASPPEEDVISQAPSVSIDSVDSMKIAELKVELERLGLPRSGSRDTLKARLKEAIAEVKPS